MSAENPRPFNVEGAHGETIAIPEKRYYRSTKARPERLQRKAMPGEAGQVWACLELATIAFSREKALTLGSDGGERPLTNADISRRTGLSKQNVRRGLAWLENAGLADRGLINPDKPLQNGNIVIYAWAEPHPPKSTQGEEGSHARLPFPDWLPESWGLLKPFIRRRRITLAADLPPEEVAARDCLDRVAELARDYLEIEKKLARELEPFCAQVISAPIKEKEKERNERTKDAAPATIQAFPAAPVRSFVPSPSPIRETLRTFLAEFPGRFGLSTLPDNTALDLIAAQIPNDEVLGRFRRMAAEQKPRPNGGGWKYFIPMAENCRKGWEADEAILKKLEEEREAKEERWRKEAAAAEAWAAANPEPEPKAEDPKDPIRAVSPDRERREAMRRETSADMALLTAEIEEKIARKRAKTEGLMKGRGKAESA